MARPAGGRRQTPVTFEVPVDPPEAVLEQLEREKARVKALQDANLKN